MQMIGELHSEQGNKNELYQTRNGVILLRVILNIL